MSELTKLITQITVICAKELSDALLTIASKISAIESQDNPIIVSSKPNIASLAIGNHVVFILRSGKKYGGKVVRIDGDIIEVENEPMSKSWTISTSQLFDISDGDFYYNK